MKGRSNRLPTAISDPPDDWVNGSWTVDCICGVNFDDGEEMVNCDECGVWVHTRCSRFIRGEKSFACDKCKIKTSKNDTEETEVAQLLIELPTKTIKMNNAYPLQNPSSWRPYRLWTDRPIEERVHVQGIPGGDPALFKGFPSLFSSELWKCTGYVPKKFNFSFREFPCWDGQQDINAKAGADAENTIDKGAGVLYSLSKETTMAAHAPALASVGGQVKGGDSDKKASKKRKWEDGDLKNRSLNNSAKREKMLRPIVLHCGKTSREDLEPSKDRSGKKKNKYFPKELDSKRDNVHVKTVVVHATNARQVELHESKSEKDLKSDVLDGKHGQENDAGSHEVVSNADLVVGSSTEKPKRNIATNDGDLPTKYGLGYLSEKRVKEEKLGHDACHQICKLTKTEVISLPLLEKDGISRNPMEKKGLGLNDVDRNPGADSESPTVDVPNSKPLVGDIANAASEVKETEVSANLETNTLLRSAHSELDVENPKGVVKNYTYGIDAEADAMKDLTAQVLSADHESENSKVNEAVTTSSQSTEHDRQDSDKSLEAVSGSQFDQDDEVTENPSNTKLECEGSESSMEVHKTSSESKEAPRIVGEKSKPIGSIPSPSSCEHKLVSVGRSASSSTIVISRPSFSDKNRTGTSQVPSSIGKRVISNASMSTRKVNPPIDPVKDENKHEKPKSMVKDNPKSSHNPTLRASQPSRTANSHVFKHCTSAGKDSLRRASSKSSSVESSSLPSGVCEPAGSLQTPHSSHLQNKTMASGGLHRGEKVPQSNLQSSFRSTLSSLGHLSAASNSPAGLSDEELALLLHQELNSSPRVPRVPRVRQAGSLPQLSSASATSMLIKRTYSSGGKDQHTFSRRKSKDVHKDGSRSSREHDNEVKMVDRVPSSPDSAKTSDALTHTVANSEPLHSVQKSAEQISSSAANSGPSFDANELKFSTTQHSPVNNPEDDTATNMGLAPISRTLPGLIAEIMGKGKRMTYEQLCNAVLPHWQNLRKHNGERYAYSTHSQAVLDCLRNRTEWAQLVDRGPKTNASRKRRKMEAEPENTQSEDVEGRSLKDGESKSFEASREEFPKGRRKARRRRRLSLKGRHIKDDRKSMKVEVGSDDTGSFSNSSEDGMSSEDDGQESGMCVARLEVSASSDEVAAVS